MNKFITLRVPCYRDGGISDESIYINVNMISEILPHDTAACRGDSDGWNTKIIMSNGSKYNVVEEPTKIIELITAIELG